MQSDQAPGWRVPRHRAPVQSGVESRPSTVASVASVASSTSSFRIPGITPVVRVHSQQPQPSTRSSAPKPFVRLFTPQSDDPVPLFFSDDTDQSHPVNWLDKHGPSPRDLLESSQGPSVSLHVPHAPSAEALPTPHAEDQLRPFTASSYHRSKLVTADGSVGSYVCAILENRGTGREVGIASIERESGLCVITQLADTPTYVRTIHHLSMYPPSILLVPASGLHSRQNATSSNSSRTTKRPKLWDDNRSASLGETTDNASQRSSTSILIRCLEELFGIQASAFPRKHWNYLEGARYLDRLLVDDADEVQDSNDNMEPAASQDDAVRSQQSRRPRSSRPQTGRSSLDSSAKASTRAAILVAVASKFYLLSAVAGLFDFYTEAFHRVFTPKSLRIRFVVPEGTILINSNTAHDLELVRNLIDPRSKDSLYGLLNHCASPMGQRLLKMNILQPLTDLDAIAARQEAVAECIRNEERFYAIRESLKPIRDMSIDLDKLIHTFSCPAKRETATRADTERKISSILSLRTVLRSLQPARDALQNSSSDLLRTVSGFLDSDALDAISESIHTTIDPDIIHAKGGLSSRHAKMYAVRAERSPLLDVARETYRENIGDILELLKKESDETGLSLKLKLIETGFLFQVKLEHNQMTELPSQFTNVSRAKSGKLVTMMTLALKKLNARLVDSMNEVCTMSDLIIEQLIEEIVGQVASLYKLDKQVSEALSFLDMVVSFAQVSIANNYVRPTFGARLDIRNARHPILDRFDILSSGTTSVVTRRRQPFVPNDIYLGPGERVCLVTGPNMSGKSTFIRQIALITVLACVGCFVPATRATLPIPDALLSLLTHEDDATQNLSTFAAEMRTSAFILSVGTPKSLVILDEVGRGTSPDEGCAVATAIVEEMISEKGSTVFFATHFGELVDGLEGKEGVVCQHLEVSTVQGDEDVGLVFHHKLHLGPGLNTHYSLQVAKMMGCFSRDFLQRAQDVAVVEQATNADRAAITDSRTRERRKLMRSVVRDLRRLIKEASSIDNFSEDVETGERQDAQPLIEKLCHLQLNASTELRATFDE